jgi:two-component system NtrC family response regulator/two-component system response regulator AtoC
MQRLRALIARVAPTNVPVLIEGATGTGKELVATMLHRLSGRSGPFVPFNVCALPDSMFEDALFGHVKGAYTGAVADTPGYLREANGGTAFFDEISGLALGLQPKLLRAIETRTIRAVGSSRDVTSDFRVVAATNERLEDLVDAGRFRVDLNHRLSGLVLTVPTLADRNDDMPALVEHFTRRARSGRTVKVTRDAMQVLRQRHWPGNIRELKQVIEAALLFAGDVLDVDALAIVLSQRARLGDRSGPSASYVEREHLLGVLRSANWDTEQAAESLGVHRTTIYRRMRRLGIPLPSNAPLESREGVAATSGVSTFAPIRDDLQLSSATRANATA